MLTTMSGRLTADHQLFYAVKTGASLEQVYQVRANFNRNKYYVLAMCKAGSAVWVKCLSKQLLAGTSMLLR